MAEESRNPAFVAAPFGLLRLPSLPVRRARAAAGRAVDPEDPGRLEDLREYVREAVADPVVREALEVSSASLTRTLAALDAGHALPAARMRKAAYTVTKYLLRMSSRPTPFGLMAGVAPVEFGGEAAFRLGESVAKVARPDSAWLMDLVRQWERHPDVLPHLRVVFNNLAVERGERLTLPGSRDGGNYSPGHHEISVRNTAAVRHTMRLAATSVLFQDLVTGLADAFPGTPDHHITAMLGQLIEQELLLTDLRPAQHAEDPLAHVLDRLTAAGHPYARDLAAIRDAIDGFTSAPPGTGRTGLHTAHTAMAALNRSDRPLQVDMRVDALAVLPAVVGEELARAADALWRITPDPVQPHLRDYHDAFVERYGYNQGVALKELLDPVRGLGAPAGYRWPPSTRAEEPHSRQDAERGLLLAGLAQEALLSGAREIVLDDAVITELTRLDPHRDAPQALDLCFTVLADSIESMSAGDFHLALSDGAGAAELGGYSGRFLHMLPELVSRVEATVTEQLAQDDAAVPAQVFFQPAQFRQGNVSHVPAVLERRIVAGAYDEGRAPEALALDDLLIAADRRRLRVVSRSLDREIAPMFFHMLNPMTGKPNAVRLLSDIAQVRRWPLRSWQWGESARLPYLPRVRHGRTALAPARWLPSPALKDGARSWPSWLAALGEWRARWAVPDLVELSNGDQRLPVDLGSTLHLRLFRQELRKVPHLVVTESPFGRTPGAGWCAGHANEVVVSLTPLHRPSLTPQPHRRVATGPVRAQHHPGGPWLYAKIYLPAEHHDELLTEHLPHLLADIDGLVEHWHFLRYRDPHAHVRLRVHGDPATLSGKVLARLHDWTASAQEAGLLQRMTLDTYEPEYVRYGGEDLIGPAERAFAADSRAVLAQLRLLAQEEITLDPVLVAAANHIDLFRNLYGDANGERILSLYPKDDRIHGAFQTHRSAARALNPAGDWQELSRVSGGDRLIEVWADRAPAIAAYGQALRSRFTTPDESHRIDSAASSVLHMHVNRLLGIDPQREDASYAVARGVVESARNRVRFAR
ncbi:lantibiotic dehydratase [Nonomuraea dietziae]|uniref:lantibiotic dehydratase n=1 Tax=Nonomuraea dietziae TaxID=65515 RepID=UPI003407CFFA